MHRGVFVNRSAAENAAGWPGWAIISIANAMMSSPKLRPGWYEIHRACFDDVGPYCDASHSPMTFEQVIEIVNFVHLKLKAYWSIVRTASADELQSRNGSQESTDYLST